MKQDKTDNIDISNQVSNFNKTLDQTYNRDKSRVDPFDIEELVRICFDLEEKQETPDGINISYNDLVDYTTYIVKMTLDSYDRKISNLKNIQNNG